MSVCPHCHSVVGPDALFCPSCGTSLTDRSTSGKKNLCTNPECSRFKEQFAFAPGVQFCDQCGNFTTDGKEIDALT